MKIVPLVLLLSSCGGQSRATWTHDFTAPAPSRLPELANDPAGGAWLTWVEESSAGTARLWCARRAGGAFGPPREIASGDRWFVNWADFPTLAALSEEILAATWLERTGEGTYDYRVRLVRSVDAGASWSEPVTLHDHAGGGEHGFVSLVAPFDPAGFAAAWLDGREVREVDGKVEGAMALRARTFGTEGALGPEALLDPRVCDCCPTAAVGSPLGGLLVAYRDRGEDEMRDISIVRWENGARPQRVWESGDGWRIAGCPVNGPALAVQGSRVAVAWFTLGSDAIPRVLCALSTNGGASFAPPIRLASTGAAGRVDAVFDGQGRLAVSWLQELEGEVRWCVGRIEPSGSKGPMIPVAAASAGRASGYARLARDGDAVLLAFTHGGDPPRVAVERILWR